MMNMAEIEFVRLNAAVGSGLLILRPSIELQVPPDSRFRAKNNHSHCYGTKLDLRLSFVTLNMRLFSRARKQLGAKQQKVNMLL